MSAVFEHWAYKQAKKAKNRKKGEGKENNIKWGKEERTKHNEFTLKPPPMNHKPKPGSSLSQG
jgi:hypothetical protein